MAQSKFKTTTGSIASAIACAVLMSAGCIVDDRNGTRGQANAPTASVPDTGGPIRRESPTKTLNEADPKSPNDVTLEVK